MNDPFQVCMAPLAEVSAVVAAMVVFHPSPGSMDARFPTQTEATKWRALEELAEKYRTLGESEEVDQAVLIEGAPHRLVATTADPFQKYGTPFVLALLAAPAVTEPQLEALRSAIRRCMGAIYSR